MFPKTSNILVVDDSFNIRRLVCDTLRNIGFSNVVAAEDAIEAMNKLKEHSESTSPIDLILSDLNMPGPSGLEFLRDVRSMDQFKDLPFILVTTESEKGAVIEAAVSGVSSYVVKPFDLNTLSKRLMEAWKKHSSEKN